MQSKDTSKHSIAQYRRSRTERPSTFTTSNIHGRKRLGDICIIVNPEAGAWNALKGSREPSIGVVRAIYATDPDAGDEVSTKLAETDGHESVEAQTTWKINTNHI